MKASKIRIKHRSLNKTYISKKIKNPLNNYINIRNLYNLINWSEKNIIKNIIK